MPDRIKKLFQSAASRNGSLSVGVIVLVTAIVIVVNLIAGQLPEKVKNIDISDNRIYEISDKSRNILKKLDKPVTFKVFAEKDKTDERIKTFIRKYTALSDKIKVEWIDPVLHPSELSANNAKADTVLISCKDTKKSTTVAFSDIIVSDESSYYMTGNVSESKFDGEGRFTSAVSYVTGDEVKKVYYTTGHGESTFSSSVSDLLDKNNMEEEELNLIMKNKIPDDCGLLFLYGPVSDITAEEKEILSSYLASGGKVFLLLGDAQDGTPNLDALMREYGMERTDGYIADMQRSYQGNYYYIFPELSSSAGLTDGMASDMVMLVNAHGMSVTDPARDTITATPFMTTSADGYAVTEDSQKQGTYTLGAVSTESVSDGEEARFTVITADTLIDPQVTEAFSTLENLTLFTNAVSANFEDMENVAIEPKSLEVTYNSMRHAGVISMIVIFGIPAVILIYGFLRWMKRRKA